MIQADAKQPIASSPAPESSAPNRDPARAIAGPRLSPILSAALDLFYETGYHGTSVRDIARRVGQTVPSLYYYHKNKEAILHALLDSSISEVTKLCADVVGRKDLPPEQRYVEVVECLVLYMAMNRKLAAMDAEIRYLSVDVRKAYAGRRKVIERMIIDLIDEGVASGKFSVRSTHETARALLGMIQAVAIWFHPGGPLTAQAVAGEYVYIAVNLVGGSSEVKELARASE